MGGLQARKPANAEACPNAPDFANRVRSFEDGESPSVAALRELREESGLHPTAKLHYLGQAPIGAPPIVWYFYALKIEGLPTSWDHQTEDDFGHVFSFFWHPMAVDLDHHWHPIFHEAIRTIRHALPMAARW